MPLKSQAQRRWMFATHPEMAHRWAAETPRISDLPERAKPARQPSRYRVPTRKGK